MATIPVNTTDTVIFLGGSGEFNGSYSGEFDAVGFKNA